jgi:hypothetical protein
MSDSNNNAVFVGDFPLVNSCNVGDLLMLTVFSDPSNTETAMLVNITVNNFINVIKTHLP